MGTTSPAAVPSAPPPRSRPVRQRATATSRWWIGAGITAALAVSVAWIPARQHNATVDIALALVIVITAAGATGRRTAVAATALAAAFGFTFFDTAPYEQLAIARGPDILTDVVLVVVGVLTGELAVRLALQRRSDHTVTGDLGRVRDAATLLANGEELVVMIGAVASQLERLLDLEDCWFAADPVEPGSLIVDRQGVVARSEAAGPVLAPAYHRPDHLALPVWGQGQILGHFALARRPETEPRRDQLLVAVTLADQVGAALYAQAPPGPPITWDPEPLLPALRVELAEPASTTDDEPTDDEPTDEASTDVEPETEPTVPRLRVIRGGASTAPPT